jgi:tryptophan synthase alpha chain
MHGMVSRRRRRDRTRSCFPDPSADGPVIQKAGEKALALWPAQVLDIRAFAPATRPRRWKAGWVTPTRSSYDIVALKQAKSFFIRDAEFYNVDGVVDLPARGMRGIAARLRAHGMT